MSGRVPAGTLQDKIVFVGTTALGTREVVATPLDTLFVGVEVQATVADNLLQQDFISRSQFGTALEGLVVLVLGIAVTWLVASYGHAVRSARQRHQHCRAVVFRRVGALDDRRVRVAADAHDRRDCRAGRHDPREVHRRARAGRHGRARKNQRSAPDGADAAVADRDPGCRNRPSLASNAAVRPAARRAAFHQS